MFLDHSTNTIYGIRSEYHLWYEGGLSRSSLRKVRFRLDDFAFRVILLSAAEGGDQYVTIFFALQAMLLKFSPVAGRAKKKLCHWVGITSAKCGLKLKKHSVPW